MVEHDAVADVAVISVPDEERGKVPKAFVILTIGFEPSDELRSALRQDIRDRLAEYEYPRQIESIDELLKTPSGKIRRTS